MTSVENISLNKDVNVSQIYCSYLSWLN